MNAVGLLNTAIEQLQISFYNSRGDVIKCDVYDIMWYRQVWKALQQADNE